MMELVFSTEICVRSVEASTKFHSNQHTLILRITQHSLQLVTYCSELLSAQDTEVQQTNQWSFTDGGQI